MTQTAKVTPGSGMNTAVQVDNGRATTVGNSRIKHSALGGRLTLLSCGLDVECAAAVRARYQRLSKAVPRMTNCTANCFCKSETVWLQLGDTGKEVKTRSTHHPQL